MAFQQSVSQKQALGNLGQISTSPQGFCNVKAFVAKDNSVKIGEFVKLVTGTNEVVTAQDGTLTGEVLGVCVNDSLQVSNNSTNADISKKAGSSVQILLEGNIFVRTNLSALIGQFVLIDQTDGSLFFSDTAEATGFIYTGWRVSKENNPANPGIIEITTAGASKSAGGGGGGVVIDDTTVSPTKAWSSNKINTELNTKVSIADDEVTTTKGWSSSKIKDEIDDIIDDTRAVTDHVWSSDQTKTYVDEKIDDDHHLPDKTWSSEFIKQYVDEKIDDTKGEGDTDFTWSADKLSGLIDDTKGEGDTENTWSADKLSGLIDDDEIDTEKTWSSDKISKISSSFGLPSRVNKQGDYLYHLDYSSIDYETAKTIAGGYETALSGGCTAIYKDGILGRNFDWNYSEEIEAIVQVNRSAANYGSVAFCGGVAGLTADKMSAKTYEPNDLKILPFFVRDGVNEHGLGFSINIVPSLNNDDIIPATSIEHTISAVCLGRFVLDNFKTAAEAVAYIRNYVKVVFSDTLTALGYEAHYLIADKERAYCIEFKDNTLISERLKDASYPAGKMGILTNFHRNGVTFNDNEQVYTPYYDGGVGGKPHADNNIELNGQGLERHNLAVNLYSSIASKETMISAMDALLFTRGAYLPTNPSATVFYTDFVGTNSLNVDSPLSQFRTAQTNARNEYITEGSDDTRREVGILWHSLHSVAYDLKTLEIKYYLDENSSTRSSKVIEFGGGGAVIDDTTTSLEKTWSSEKIQDELDLKAEISDDVTELTSTWSSQKIQEEISSGGSLTFDDIYPIGSIYISIGDVKPAFGSWLKLATGTTLWNDATPDGRKISAGLPNITGNASNGSDTLGIGSPYFTQRNGAFIDNTTLSNMGYSAKTGQTSSKYFNLKFDASASNAIYGASTTVQPPAIAVSMWKRIEERNGLKFTAEQANSKVSLAKVGSPDDITLEYSLNGEEWVDYTLTNQITLTNTGDFVVFRNKSSQNLSLSTAHYYQFTMTGKIAADGSVDYLYRNDGSTFALNDAQYAYLFSGCTSLTQTPELPALILSSNCYRGMFSGCTNMLSVPRLLATTMYTSCYANMFENCTSLLQAPDLPATNLANWCYQDMFMGCINLQAGPNELPATTLKQGCYQGMFADCARLRYIPSELPATTLLNSCYRSMFYGCDGLRTPPIIAATRMATDCCRSMFNACSNLEQAPELPATNLAADCYQYMFQDCTSLTEAPALPATTLDASCYFGMFSGCSALTTPPELPATTLNQSCYYEMFRGCSSLTEAPELPATTLAVSCYYAMFQDCSSLTEAPALPATTLRDYCYQSMFLDCSSLTTPPEISATTLASASCYKMFNGCSSLKVRAGGGTEFFTCPATIPSNAVTDMFLGTAGTFTGTPTANTTYCWYVKDGLNFTAEEANSKVALTKVGSPSDITLEYSLNGASWQDYSIGNEISLTNIGDVITFRNKGSQSRILSASDYYKFTMAGKIAANGSVDYLYRNDGTAFALNSYQYFNLFKDCSSLTTPPTLPATTLATYCYQSMFYGCSSLTTAPSSLPATTLASNCYNSMFRNCSSLTTAPALPATTLATYCYQAMFRNCSSLTTAPSLPATTLADRCYYYMFYGCSSLTTAPSLPATTLADSCYQSMFYDCSKLKVRNSSATGATKIFTCPSSLPANAVDNMFASTGGTFVGTPVVNGTYYWYN